MTIRFGKNPNTRTAFPMHMLDSHAGTHLVPPAYALPAPGFDNSDAMPRGAAVAARIREKARPARHQRRHHGEGAHRADLRAGPGHRREAPARHHPKEQWPASPEITEADIQAIREEARRR